MNHSCNYHLIILDQYQCIQFRGKFNSFLCLHVGIRLEEGAPYEQIHSLILSVLKMKKMFGNSSVLPISFQIVV
jgi:hypothetical protein